MVSLPPEVVQHIMAYLPRDRDRCSPTARIMHNEIQYINKYMHKYQHTDMYETYNFMTSSFADFFFHKELFYDFFDFEPNYVSLSRREFENFHNIYKDYNRRYFIHNKYLNQLCYTRNVPLLAL